MQDGAPVRLQIVGEHSYVITIVHGTYSATIGAKLQYIYIQMGLITIIPTVFVQLSNYLFQIYDVDFLVHFT